MVFACQSLLIFNEQASGIWSALNICVFRDVSWLSLADMGILSWQITDQTDDAEDMFAVGNLLDSKEILSLLGK